MLDASCFFTGGIFLFKNERINFWHQNHRRWGQVPALLNESMNHAIAMQRPRMIIMYIF
jgi:hypothetical protein